MDMIKRLSALIAAFILFSAAVYAAEFQVDYSETDGDVLKIEGWASNKKVT